MKLREFMGATLLLGAHRLVELKFSYFLNPFLQYLFSSVVKVAIGQFSEHFLVWILIPGKRFSIFAFHLG